MKIRRFESRYIVNWWISKSGGQQQRVAIGRSLIYRPAIILADEPTRNLDRKNSNEIVELLKLSNKKYKQTILLITHDEKMALETDRIVTMEDGKIVSDEVIRQWKSLPNILGTI